MLPVPPIPTRLLDEADLTLPSPAFAEWIRAAFIADPVSPLYNPDHAHLATATIGVLLTSSDGTNRHGQRLLGTCGLAEPNGKPWAVAQRRQQLKAWFEFAPTFLITLDAVWLSTATPLQACALIDGHELYHAGIKRDRWGAPAFDKKTGKPLFDVRPHDVEAFCGEVRRYGAWSEELAEMKEAFASPPTFTVEALGGFCGCGAKI